MMNKKT
jgi:hypothetical protein